MITVHVVVFQIHDSLGHLLRGVRGTRRRLEVMMSRAEGIHLLPWASGMLHHIIAPLKLCQVLLHLKIRLRR